MYEHSPKQHHPFAIRNDRYEDSGDESVEENKEQREEQIEAELDESYDPPPPPKVKLVFFFFQVLVGPKSILWGHYKPSFSDYG